MARRGGYVRAEAVHFLDDAGRFWKQCIDVLSRAQPQGPLYKAVDAIDGVAGDCKRFHQVSPRTPGPELPPEKRWRTVG